MRSLGREKILQLGELIQIQAGEFRGKSHKPYEAINKQLMNLINKEQDGESEHFQFLKQKHSTKFRAQ